MADDVLVVVEDDDVEERPPSPPRGWLAWLGLAAVGLVLLASTLPSSEQEAPTTTFPPVPTVSVPELVEQTLTWEQATGFDEAEHIDGVIRFGDAWWAVGSTADGLGVWTSDGEPGQPWKLAARPGDNDVDGWVANDIEVLNGRIVIAAGPDNGLTAGAIFESTDGVKWTRRDLAGPSVELGTIPMQVIPTDAGVTVRGFGSAGFTDEMVAGVLPDHLSRLIETDRAEFTVSNSGEVIVFVAPGIEVARFQAEELGSEVPPAPQRSPLVWRGFTLDDLSVSREAWFPFDVQATETGTLMAPIGIQLAYSEDGEEWEPVGPHLEDLMAFVPWRDGAAVVVQGEEPAYWRDSSRTLEPLFPDELLVDPTTQFSQVVADDVGLAALASGIAAGGSSAVRTPVVEMDDYELFLAEGVTVELLHDDEIAWRNLVWNTPVALDESGVLHFGEPPDEVGVPIEDWLEALRHHTPIEVAIAEDLRVVHSSDGQEWSSTTWAAITGMERAVSLNLFATDDFILAADQTRFAVPYMNGVWLGRPIE